MNTASSMESSCPYGAIHVSADTAVLLQDKRLQYRGGMEVKGMGMMDT